ncbi:hypothetical protein C5167_035323 [Papaver somniferum]|uniref:protein-serine/threonine phosphatase n=1 Tax=Papaver somniferum TaxID=3469 RepID=A0A4Y7KFI0_PAPSO|nr:hypothetical protein C5167_035323 [Papaver somniferum]
MLKSIKKLYSLCWKPFSVNPHSSSSSSDDGFSNSGGDGGKRDRNDKSLWYKELGKCSSGDFSMAVVQANQVLEDQSQIESFGGDTTFVGLYDGHGGPDTARYVCDNLYRHSREISEEAHGVTSETIRRAFLETEQGYTAIVDQLWDTRPNLATVGSCCLVGVVCQQTLYVANLGDSRVVLGEKISRCIGDLYLKDNKYNTEQILGKFRLLEPMLKPVLSADPAVMSFPLQPNDLFLIFASDGLWEHLSNEQAVEIVHRNPRAGSARILLKAALQEVARKREMRYEDLRRIDKKFPTGFQRASNCIQVSAGSQKARVQDKEDICRIEENGMRDYHDDICRTKKISTGVAAIELSSGRNANMEEVRTELTELQPDDTQVVGQKHGVWRVKGIIQILRSIGDLCVKDDKYHTRQIRGSSDNRFLLGGLELNLTRLYSFSKYCTFRKSMSGPSLLTLCRRVSPGLPNLTTIQVRVPPPPVSVEGPPPPLNSKEDALGEILPYLVA